MLSTRIPTLADFESLAAVARTGSLSTAAVDLGVTQQALSQRIRAMERQVGVPLLVRTPKGSQLTPAGALVEQWAARLLSVGAGIEAGLAALRTDRRAHLRLAASLTVAEYLLPGWLVRLREQTGTDIELRAINSDSVLVEVRAGRADLGFVEGPRPATGLHTRTVGSDRLVLVVPAGHPWTRRRTPVDAALLARTPLVSREPGSGSRQALDDALSAVGLRPAPSALELTSASAVRAAVAAGAGPAALSSLAVADDLALGRVVAVPVTGLDLTRRLRVVWSGDPRPPAGPARSLLAVIRAADPPPGLAQRS